MMRTGGAVLAVGLAALCLLASCQQQVEQGVQKATEKKFDERLYAGGTLESGQTGYAANLSFDLTAASATSGDTTEIVVSGVVRNNGDKTVTWLNLAVSLVDAEGVEVAGGSDIVAHTLPIGENNTPLTPGTAKRVTIHIRRSVDVKNLKVVPHVVDLAVK
jgi:glutaredoxin-related protein